MRKSGMDGAFAVPWPTRVSRLPKAALRSCRPQCRQQKEIAPPHAHGYLPFMVPQAYLVMLQRCVCAEGTRCVFHLRAPWQGALPVVESHPANAPAGATGAAMEETKW